MKGTKLGSTVDLSELRISSRSGSCPNGQMEESQEKRFAVVKYTLRLA